MNSDAAKSTTGVPAAPSVELQRNPAVVCSDWLDESVEVPKNVAVCPECGYTLEAVIDGWSEDHGYSIDVNCGMDDFEGDWHRYWQGEWQPVIDVVEAWANSSNEK